MTDQELFEYFKLALANSELVLDMTPEEIMERFKFSVENYSDYTFEESLTISKDPSDLVSSVFLWGDTIEGTDWWYNFYDSLSTIYQENHSG